MIFRRRLSLREILFGISLMFLLMPLFGIYFLRIYESALIRQTESELISQAAFVSALYKSEVLSRLPLNDVRTFGQKIRVSKRTPLITPKLDLAKDPILPARPQAKIALSVSDKVSKDAGLAVTPILEDAQHITLSGIKILDYNGTVVAGREENGLSFAHVKEFQQAKTGRPISVLRARRMPANYAPLNSYSRNTTLNVYVALPILLNDRLIGVVWLNRTPTDLLQALYGKRRELIWTTIALLTLTLLISFFTSYTVTRPIRTLVHNARKITQGDTESFGPLTHPITSEVAELSESITEMAKAIEYRSHYIRNFAAHVSHEFKTPMTSIQAAAELLLEDLDRMPREQQQRFLDNIRSDSERLNHLVTRLLALAKADMADRYAGNVDLYSLLLGVAADRSSDKLAVRVSMAPAGSIYVKASEESVKAIFTHLLENSLQAGATSVELRIEPNVSFTAVYVLDNGPGISAGNAAEIFNSFFTTKRAEGGTGLGLNIAKSLMERYGGSVQLVPSEAGALFKLSFLNA